MRLELATFLEKCKRKFHHLFLGFLPNVIFAKIASSAKSSIPKVIWATVSIASLGTLVIFLGFWVSWEITGGVLVALGCMGEWYLINRPTQERHEPGHEILEKQCVMVVAIGVTMELFGLVVHTIPESFRLERDVRVATGLAKSNELQVVIAQSNLARVTQMGLGLKTNVASLGTAVLELAKLNDQSANALAVANERLAAIKPAIDPWRISETASNELRRLIAVSWRPCLTNNIWVMYLENSGAPFARDLLGVLSSAPKARREFIRAFNCGFLFDAEEYGVTIFVNPKNETLGKDMRTWLFEAHTLTSLKSEDSTPTNTTLLVVGKKPWTSN
jgi:hypothetical protein